VKPNPEKNISGQHLHATTPFLRCSPEYKFQDVHLAAILGGAGFRKEHSPNEAQSTKIFSLIRQGVLELSDRNQIQDGFYSRHLG
jgi:hypothetical protein